MTEKTIISQTLSKERNDLDISQTMSNSDVIEKYSVGLRLVESLFITCFT